MEQPVPVKEVKILETAEDIQQRREQVLKRYVDFKEAARVKRDKLEDSRRYQVIQTKRYDKPLLFWFEIFFNTVPIFSELMSCYQSIFEP